MTDGDDGEFGCLRDGQNDVGDLVSCRLDYLVDCCALESRCATDSSG